jgi:hypothetical protein
VGSTTKHNYDESDEVRTPPLATVNVVNLGDVATSRAVLQPGWRWSESVKPIAGTDSCQFRHVGTALSGRLVVQHGDESVELGPGDAYVIDPGHDAWVVGDEPFVAVEFEDRTARSYATS